MSLTRTLVVLTAFLCLSLTPISPVNGLENYRLPTTIWPKTYNLTLRPYLLETDESNRFTFDGEVIIEINAVESTNKIVLHSKNLNYTVQQYWNSTAPEPVNLTTPTLNSTTDQLTFELARNLSVNEVYYLYFKYKGSMDDDMHGFYRSYYVNNQNVTKWIGSTQFETNHARRAFPSFDEPKFKASFNLTIIRHKSFKSVANTRFNSVWDGDYIRDVYLPTPKMSTYLLAFIVSDFNERSDGDFSVLARPEYFTQTEYSFEVGRKILAALDDYLEIPYYGMGIDKMHMAAIPDFSAGAMENWGLLTYRERSLLVEEGSTTLSARQSIAAVVAHEQTHMWFGDLVTCNWWSYTWLNEGFARYFQYFATAWVESDWELEKQFVVDQIQSVMSLDSTNSTNPMSDENTYTSSDLSRMFNTISYNKGASFIRMVKHVMGEEKFKNSLNHYLEANKYEAPVPQDLLTSWLQFWPSETKSYAEPIFKSFTEQVGYPLITVNVSSAKTSFDISQKRFLLKENDGSDPDLLYTVPITYTTDKKNDFNTTTPALFLNATTDKRTINLDTNTTWVIANIQETGFYRVNYDTSNWHAIHHALHSTNWSGIHELNRAQVVDDLLTLARAGVIEYDLALDVLEYLESETNYLPWTAAFNGLSYIGIRLGTDTDAFGSYIKEITNRVYNQLGFEEKDTDSALDIYNRAKVLAWSCKYKHSGCISQAKSYFNNINNSPVPVNIRSVVYCTAMREGTETDFDFLFNKYKTELVPTEETLILNNLGCVKDEDLVSKFFWIIISDDVRRQDKSTALSYLYSENNENVTPVFNLVTENFEKLADALGSYSSVATVISNIASRFTEESQKESLEKFTNENKSKFGTSASTLETAIKTVQENLDWSTKRLSEFKDYLVLRHNGSPTLKGFTALTLVLVAVIASLLR